MSTTRRRRGRSDESGVALLIVLLTISLLTIIVIEFTYSAQVETHLAMSARNALQATYLARSGLNVAEAILVRDAQAGRSDSEHDIWARPLPPLPLGDGEMAVRVQDEARALNVNDLVSSPSVNERERRRQVFERLFDILGVEQRVLAAIIDWIDADDDAWPAPIGAEQPYYSGQTPPVAVRNGPILTMRELLLVRDVTPEVLRRLDGYVTALPPQGKLRVNVNTTSPEVLYAISPALAANPGIVDQLVAARREQPLESRLELKAIRGWDEVMPGLEAEGAVALDFDSAFFRIEAVGKVNDVTRGVVALDKRDGKKVTRVTVRDSVAGLALTSQPPSDFLQALPPLGGNGG